MLHDGPRVAGSSRGSTAGFVGGSRQPAHGGWEVGGLGLQRRILLPSGPHDTQRLTVPATAESKTVLDGNRRTASGAEFSAEMPLCALHATLDRLVRVFGQLGRPRFGLRPPAPRDADISVGPLGHRAWGAAVFAGRIVQSRWSPRAARDGYQHRTAQWGPAAPPAATQPAAVPAAVAPPPPPAADVLLEFAAAARGDNADALADWHGGTDACTWTGVACSGQAVTALRVPGAGLRGTLAPGLAQLTSLQHMCVAKAVASSCLSHSAYHSTCAGSGSYSHLAPCLPCLPPCPAAATWRAMSCVGACRHAGPGWSGWSA